MTFTAKQVQAATAIVAIKAYEKMNKHWRIPKLHETCKTESRIWKTATLADEFDNTNGNTLLYDGKIENFGQELEKLLDTNNVLDCQIAAYTALACVVKKLLGEKFTSYCKSLYEELEKRHETHRFFFAISECFKVNANGSFVGSHVYAFNVEEHVKFNHLSPARGMHMFITQEANGALKFIGYEKSFSNGPIGFEQVADMFLKGFCSNEYLSDPPPKELEQARQKYKSNFGLFMYTIQGLCQKNNYSKILSADLINQYLVKGKFKVPGGDSEQLQCINFDLSGF